MSTDPKYTPSTSSSRNSDKAPGPDHKGGNAEGNAHHWAGGSKAAKGGASRGDKHNENSTDKS